jgi:hypothetical protein
MYKTGSAAPGLIISILFKYLWSFAITSIASVSPVSTAVAAAAIAAATATISAAAIATPVATAFAATTTITATAVTTAVTTAAVTATIATAAVTATAAATIASTAIAATAVTAAATATITAATVATATAAAAITAAAATAAVAAAAAITAATSASGFVRLFDGHLLPANSSIVQCFDRALRLGLIRHIYKPEAFTSSRLPIHHNLCKIHCAIKFKHFFQVHIVKIIRKTCHKKLHADRFKEVKLQR